MTPKAPDTSLTDAAAQLRLGIVRTARRLRQEAAAEATGLTPTSTAALATIERHGPLTPSELADGERVKRPTATRFVHCLERAGLVSRTDVLAVYDRPDEDICEEITGNVILRGFLEDPRQFAVTVQAGVVTVQGSPETAALGHDIVRKIRHAPGVVAVDDQLSYPDIYPVVAGPVF